MMQYARFRCAATLAAAALPAALGVLLTSQCAAQPAWKPDRAVEFVVGSSAGGGNDRTARTMQKIWHDNKWLENIVVVNKVGGGGAIAYAYVNQHPGDAHYLAVVRMALLTNYILGRSPINYTDMTPLAIMGNEPTVFAVRADSPIKTVRNLVERWKADPSRSAFRSAARAARQPISCLRWWPKPRVWIREGSRWLLSAAVPSRSPTCSAGI